jgi:hypothetical protein
MCITVMLFLVNSTDVTYRQVFKTTCQLPYPYLGLKQAPAGRARANVDVAVDHIKRVGTYLRDDDFGPPQ